MNTRRPQTVIALAAHVVDVGASAPSEIRLLPAGQFRSSRDNRPDDVPFWLVDELAAQAVVAQANALASKFLIDYDHQTLRSAGNGQPAPAAGWGGSLEWRPGDGIYAVNVEWTESALAGIAAHEWRYISPVITHDKTTGRVTGLKMAALTNYPALDDLTDLAALAAQIFTEENPMDDLLEKLRWFLNLPLTATAADISAELDKLKPMIAAADGTTTGLSAVLVAKAETITALTAQAGEVDLSQYAPIAVVNELRAQVSELSGQTKGMQVATLIEEGVADGRIIGDAMKTWLTDMGNKDITALQGWLDSAQPITALSGMQTGGKPPAAAPEDATALSAVEKEVCAALGMTEDEFKRSK